MKGPGHAEQRAPPAGGQDRQPILLRNVWRGTSWLFSPEAATPPPAALRVCPLTRGGRSSVPSSLCRRLEELIFSSSF